MTLSRKRGFLTIMGFQKSCSVLLFAHVWAGYGINPALVRKMSSLCIRNQSVWDSRIGTSRVTWTFDEREVATTTSELLPVLHAVDQFAKFVVFGRRPVFVVTHFVMWNFIVLIE